MWAIVERIFRDVQTRKPYQVTATDPLTAQKDIYLVLLARVVSSVIVDNVSESPPLYRLAHGIGVHTYLCDPYLA